MHEISFQYEARKSKNATTAQNTEEEVEIEFKFTPPKDFNQKLEDLGAEKLKFKTMKDIYLDTPKFELIRKDHWLRYRDGKIELKVPVGSEHHRDRNTVYKELTCLRELNCMKLDIVNNIQQKIWEYCQEKNLLKCS